MSRYNTQIELAVCAAMIRSGCDGKCVEETVILGNLCPVTKKEWLNADPDMDKDWNKRAKWVLSDLSNKGKSKNQPYLPGIIRKLRGERKFEISEDFNAYLISLLEEFVDYIDEININEETGEIGDIYLNDYQVIEGEEIKLIISYDDITTIIGYLIQKNILPDFLPVDYFI